MTPEKINPRWVFRGASSEEKVAVPVFFNLNNIPEGTARIMMRRGISTEEKLTHFLYPNSFEYVTYSVSSLGARIFLEISQISAGK